MKSIQILEVRHIKNHILEIRFDDGCVKQYDFLQILDFRGVAEALKSIDFFKTVQIVENGRSLAWENGYDACADWARYYAQDLTDEWKGIEESVGLKQRMAIAQQKLATQKMMM